MNNPFVISILLVIILIVGIVVGYLIRRSIAEAKISSAENLAKQIVEEARRNADSAKKRSCHRGERRKPGISSRG